MFLFYFFFIFSNIFILSNRWRHGLCLRHRDHSLARKKNSVNKKKPTDFALRKKKLANTRYKPVTSCEEKPGTNPGRAFIFILFYFGFFFYFSFRKVREEKGVDLRRGRWLVVFSFGSFGFLLIFVFQFFIFYSFFCFFFDLATTASPARTNRRRPP